MGNFFGIYIKEVSLNFVPSIIPHLYRVDAKLLYLCDLVISYTDFLFLSSNARDVIFYYTVIKYKNGKNVPLEKFVKALPKIKWFAFRDTFDIITTSTVKKLFEISHFLLLDEIILSNLPEAFDIIEYFAYIKKSKHTKCSFSFSNSLSEAYKNSVERIVDEILETENHDYSRPLINFHGLNREKYEKLFPLPHHNFIFF
uniref:Uncharacterized protein n=1 Tax=Panagrolaimus davidi TaxID=227884 RepID=A0A914PRN0_9BILA